jgi:adenylylsulfate kinase
VIKEPRIVALADCWFEAARRSAIDVKIVIPVRHPGEVAASLAKRDQTSFALSNALWLKYNLLAERRSRRFPRVFVEYSSLLADWQKQISRISEALSVRLEDRDDDAIGEFLIHDLHRQRGGELTEAFGTPWVGEVYAAFSAAARGTRVDSDKLDEIFAGYSASERAFRSALNEFRNRHSGYHWASDLKPFLARVVDECSFEIARRFGDGIPPDEMPVDPIRTPFFDQADRVSGALESLADQGAQLRETCAKLAAQDIQLRHARSYAEKLARLERTARAFKSELDAQRRASQDRELLPDRFDRAAYLMLNPDVAGSGLDPADHYVRFGRDEGRAYASELPDGFDGAAYLALNPDVAASGVDPVRHYLNCGRYEGRACSISSSDCRELPDGFDHARPVTVWLTGLSGAGKSTLAVALKKALAETGRACVVLDGDTVRAGLNRDLGFGRGDRRENIRRIAEVARLMNDAGLVVITAFISPYQADRTLASDIIGGERFVEIHVEAPLEVCERRDPKGLYRKARRGEILDFTGISAPYEAPEAPAATLDTANRSVEECAAALFQVVISRATAQASAPASAI